ncbi:29 kDa ribonucleoprotein A, chloroplastic [Vigna radiata var. radiata]|uniref:29 kDa ribonucleoprotein A, chloroplastic n=1 Tax=Vigna radiata var. radiata TaxID=3916 RepID=A0A1S3TY46_VIGRR|nr:29 kDa ribonucleoprotein A, chloroplastic [Vigna radiata var. radiata]
MALLRVACLTSANQLSAQTYSHSIALSSLSQSINFPKRSSFHLPPLSLTTAKQTPNFTLTCVSTSQQQPQPVTEEEFSRTRLLAQNVPWTSTPEDIRSLFEKHGKVLEVELSMYKKNRNRGLAFVEMGSPEEALEALNKLESYEFEGRVMKVNYARPKKKKTPPPVKPKSGVTFNLFVGNLSYEAKSKDLKEFFDSGTAKVVRAEVVFLDNPRKPSGYGFVSFKSKKEAEAALAEFQGKDFMGRAIRVDRGRRFVQKPGDGNSKSVVDAPSELSVNGAETQEPAEETPNSEDTPELSVNGAEADKAD